MTTEFTPKNKIETVRAFGADWDVSYDVEDDSDDGRLLVPRRAVLDMVKLNGTWFFAADILTEDTCKTIEEKLNTPTRED
jgi:hypothetical protein